MRMVRPEASDDILSIHAVNLRAFGQTAEASLVDELRKNGKLLISLVAIKEGIVVGHIAFSWVKAAKDLTGFFIAGLAPMAVLPEFQRQGIGSKLVREGIEQCRKLGAGGIVVLGHPDYYPRFGFQPASRLGLQCEYDAPDEAFMEMELREGALMGRGLIRYQPEFGAFV